MTEISAYIQLHEQTIIPLYRDYSLRFWELSLSGGEEVEKALVAAKERYLHVYNNREEFRQLQEWKRANPPLSDMDARQFTLIYDSFVPNQIDKEVLRDIVERETQIENLFNTFRADFEGGKASDNQLREVLKKDRDLSRRKAAWEASKHVGHEAARQLLELVRIRNREARKLAYADYYSMMFELQELDERWVFSLLDRLERLSDAAFTAMKAELDAWLKQRLGISEEANYPWLYSDPFFQECPAAAGGE